MNKKKIVLLGGGHGLSSIIKSFIDDKYETTVIVSSTDDGGHTGLLRKEFQIPALGDIRRCIAELVDNTLISKWLNYRFDEVHNTKDLSLGNLMLLSLLDESLETTLMKLKDQLNLPLTILPSLNYSTDICGKYIDGDIVIGESSIPANKKIKKIFYNKKTHITQRIRTALKDANYIIISPGSLYTSIMPILAIEEIKKLIRKSNAKLIYISNLMTQNKETDNYSIQDMIDVIEKELKRKIDITISSSSIISENKKERYHQESSYPVTNSYSKRIKYYDLIDDKYPLIRHDYKKVKEALKKEM